MAQGLAETRTILAGSMGRPRRSTYRAATLVVTLGLTYGMVLLTPPCPGPWCLYVLVYLPVSAVGAAIAALVVGAYARRGFRGYVLALLAGVVGYGVAWVILSGGAMLR